MPVIIGGGSGNAISINSSVGTSGQVIVSDGTNASWGSASSFPAGTLMLFQQTAAPTGWTKQTTHDNKALRVVSGTASSGGTTAFTSVFTSRTPAGSVSVSGSNSGGSVSGTTLSAAQMPSHTHSYSASNDQNWPLQIQHGGEIGATFSLNGGTFGANTGGAGSDQSHAHGFTVPSWSGSGTFTGTALDFAVQYVDLIIASKN